MASSSGNSSGSTQIQNSGSEENLQILVDQRKRKRMESNRESARRSRMRKQKHLGDLMTQIDQLRSQNDQIITNIKITTDHCVSVEFENSVLRAQMVELSQRLESLNDIISCVNSSNGVFEIDDFQTGTESFVNNNPWNLMNFNQPIMADMLQY